MEIMGIVSKDIILITGGTGFIGGHLVEEFVKQGLKVIVIDKRLHDNSTFSLKKLGEKAVLELIDIRSKKKVFEIFKKYKPNYIFHLAAEPIVSKGYKNPLKTFETNIIGTVNILEAGRQNGKIKGVIIASSDKAYGKTKKAYTENSPLQGDHPYDVSKSAADLISQAYYKTFNLPVVITRFGNVYGEGDLHFNRIIPGISKAVISKQTLQIRSDGTYVRDYIYVKDVVNGYVTLFNNINKIRGEAFNFSSSETLSVIKLLSLGEKILKVKIPYKILNNAQNEIPYQHLDDTKIKKLGWKQNYTLESTLKSIVKWYNEIL